MTQPRMIDIVRSDVSSGDWDSLVFTVHWPVTTCLIWKEGRPGNTCILPDHHIWTIHGIWYVCENVCENWLCFIFTLILLHF